MITTMSYICYYLFVDGLNEPPLPPLPKVFLVSVAYHIKFSILCRMY